MKLNVKNTLIISLLCLFTACSCHAFDIDETVDDDIRKNYNPNKLIEDTGLKNKALDKSMKESVSIQKSVTSDVLPKLPTITDIEESSTSSKTTTELPTKPYTGGNIKVKSGTSFNVVNNSAISDWQRKGTKVSFKTKGNIYKKKFTIPSGTFFYGEIIESHQPQITCNGGLIVLKIYSMQYKGQTVPITAYVTRANDKKIFFNKIKGERNYLKTVWKKGDWGRNLFNKMLNVSIGLGAESSTLILTPFPFAYGTICLGANTITSPICAFFSKGGHISIPAGSNFRIKLIEDVMID